MPSLSREYHFGDFTFQPAEHRLLAGGREVVLRPKAFDTLRCLVERHDRVVSRDELLDAVWPDTSVSEAVLTHCVTEVRQALGDTAREPRFVKTVSRCGYRFVAEITTTGANADDALGAPSASAIVVLPFANLSGDAENECLCDGIAEELINALTKIGGLLVVAHSSSFSFKGRDIDAREIGRQLNVRFILEGSIRRTGDRVRLSAQLIDAAHGYHVWCDQYDRALGDLFALQDEISRAILASLPGAFGRGDRVPLVKPPTASVDAHVLYLKGRVFWHQRHGGYLERAMECFGQALAKDPGFALAYAGLADSLSTLGIWAMAPARAVFPKAATLANTALELDPHLAEAHASRALIRLFWDWEWDLAERGFLAALDLNPGNALIRLWYGHYLSIVGRMDEAIAEMRRAQRLDPLSPVCSANLGFTCYLAHRLPLAIAELEQVLGRSPRNGMALFYLGWAFIETGQYDEAVAALDAAFEETRGMPWSLEGIALAHARAGRSVRARETAERCQPAGSAVAILRLAAGDDEGTLDALEHAVEERDAMLPWLRFMPCFDHLHGHPRFREVLRRLGLLEL